MAFSFVANGRFTFAGRLTLRSAALFLGTTGVTMWVVQPVLIEAALSSRTRRARQAGRDRGLGDRELRGLPPRRVAYERPAAFRSRRSSFGSEKMSDSSALCTACASG